MDSKILYDRLFLGKRSINYFKAQYGITDNEWKRISSIEKCKEHFGNDFKVRIFKLFNAKVSNEKDIYKWNKKAKNKLKSKKHYVFSEYCEIDKDGKIVSESPEKFYKTLEFIYENQSKKKLTKHLTWLEGGESIEEHERVCNYCGVSETVLGVLYNDESYTCKTKRKRGAWFELDREDAYKENNKYTKDNMVLCCYFCNNHKSDVISVSDMRKYFGQPMFMFLMSKYDYIKSKK
jgi:hypothetical protein